MCCETAEVLNAETLREEGGQLGEGRKKLGDGDSPNQRYEQHPATRNPRSTKPR